MLRAQRKIRYCALKRLTVIQGGEGLLEQCERCKESTGGGALSTGGVKGGFPECTPELGFEE